jgi:hypothetical protein
MTTCTSWGDAEFEDGLQELVHECQKWKNKVFEIKVQRKLLDFYIGKPPSIRGFNCDDKS